MLLRSLASKLSDTEVQHSKSSSVLNRNRNFAMLGAPMSDNTIVILQLCSHISHIHSYTTYNGRAADP